MLGCLGKIALVGIVTGGLALGGCAVVMSSCAMSLGGTVERFAKSVDPHDVVGAIDRGVAKIGSFVLASPASLDGTLARSADGYTGTYRAEYVDATGSWVLFGGTDLDARSIRLTWRCEGSGGAALALRGAQGTRQLGQDAPGDGMVLELGSGSNYLCLDLDGFSGTVEVEVAETAGAPGEAGEDRRHA